jgi:hypothetical protein
MRENTIGWDDGMDSVEALQELEAIFQIKIESEEAEAMETVGEMFDVIIAKRPPNQSETCGCAMAFYRLRGAIGDHKLIPASPIEFLNLYGAKRAFAELHERTGLRLPSPHLAQLGRLGCAVAVVACVTLFVLLVGLLCGHASSWWMLGGLLVMIAGIVATRMDKGILPPDCETLGDLAKVTAAKSYGQLVDLGARARKSEMWEILTECLADLSTVSAADINRDTTFYAGQKRKAV